MNGKSKCKILKDIRRQIAAENDIVYITSECKHKGDCAGTCPKCEAEVRYLEEELRKRQLSGKKVAVAGIAAAMMITASGCDLSDILHPATGGDPLPPSGYEQVDGEIVLPTDIPGGATLGPTAGVPYEYPTDPTVETLMGDIAPEYTVPTEEPVEGEVLPEE